MTNILAEFTSKSPNILPIFDGFQYDTGRNIEFRGLTCLPASVPVQFATSETGPTESRPGEYADGVLISPIPNAVLASPVWFAFVRVVEGESGYTLKGVRVEQTQRGAPSDVVTPDQQSAFDAIVATLNAVDVNEPISVNGTWWTYDKTTGEYVDTGDPSQGETGATGATGLTGLTGATGTTGNGIASIARTSGTGAPGTTDTYTITMTSGATATFTVTHGTNGTATSVLTGYAAATVNAPIAATDNVLQAFGKAQKQISDNSTSISDLNADLDALVIGEFGTEFVTDTMLSATGVKAKIKQNTHKTSIIRKAAIIFVDDDASNIWSSGGYAAVLAAHPLAKVSLAVNPDWVGNDGKLTWSNLDAYMATGQYELVNHGAGHLEPLSMTPEQLQAQYATESSIFAAHGYADAANYYVYAGYTPPPAAPNQVKNADLKNR